MSAKPVLWVATLTTFQGISPGATHWHVSMNGAGRKIEVEWVLDEVRAAKFTRLDRRHDWPWIAGQRSNRFDYEHEAVAAARTAWAWLDGAEAGLLVRGSVALVEPQEPLAGEPGHLNRAQQFYERAEAVGWYEGDALAMTRISKEWWTWIRETFADDDHEASWRRGSEVFIITGRPDAPDGVWCSKEDDAPDEAWPGDKEPHGGLVVPPGVRP